MKSRPLFLMAFLLVLTLLGGLNIILRQKNENSIMLARRDARIAQDYSAFQDLLITGDYKDGFEILEKSPSLDQDEEFFREVAFNGLRQFWLVAGSRIPEKTSATEREKIDFTHLDSLPAYALKSVLEFDVNGKKLLKPESVFRTINNCNMTSRALTNCYELILAASPGYDSRTALSIYKNTYDLPADIWDELTSSTRVQALAVNRKWSEITREFKEIDTLKEFELEHDKIYWLYIRAMHAEKNTTSALNLTRKLENAGIPIPEGYRSFFDDLPAN